MKTRIFILTDCPYNIFESRAFCHRRQVNYRVRFTAFPLANVWDFFCLFAGDYHPAKALISCTRFTCRVPIVDKPSPV